MRNKPRSISNSRTRRASFVSRSFPFARIFDGSGCLRAKRSVQGRNTWNTLCAVHFGTRAFFVSGNRCFSCVLQNAPCGMPDVLQISTPALVSLQGVFAVLKRSWRALQCPTKVLKDLTK